VNSRDPGTRDSEMRQAGRGLCYVCLWYMRYVGGGVCICLINICRRNEIYIRLCALCSVKYLLQPLEHKTKVDITNVTL
jgi:hypothetical protein